MRKEIIAFNDNTVRKYRSYADKVDKDGDNLGFIDYLLDFHLEEYINDMECLLKLLKDFKAEKGKICLI